MTKFEKAHIPYAEKIGTVKGWMLLWRKGDPNTLRVTGEGCTEGEAAAKLLAHVEASMEGQVWLNDEYQVIARECGDGPMGVLVHLSIRRRDRGPCKDWRHFQQIKNELMGPEAEAVELYPAESRLVDCANQYHLWGFKGKGFRFPFGFQDRSVSDSTVDKSQQRPFEAGGTA